jgi:SPP1 gp7 family putative phage head morphogenesis protein
MRPPAGPELAYRKALRSLVSQAAAAVEREIFPLLEDTLPEQRRDAGQFGLGRDIVKERMARIKRGLLGADRSALPQEIAERVARANAGEIKRVLKIDVASMGTYVSDKVATFRTDNVKLIELIPAQLLDDVDKVIETAWTKGLRVEVLRKELQKRFEVSKSRADLIARDQVLKLNSQITKTRQTSAGIVEYVWTTSHDERVRGNPDGKYPDSDSDHYSLDGTRQRWDAPPVTNPKTGETNHPGEDYQCRCVAVPVLSFLDDPDLEA